MLKNKIHRIIDYIKYLYVGRSKYWIHSPFVYDFVIKVLNGNRPLETKIIEDYRTRLLRNKQTIQITDMGAGYGGAKQAQHIKCISEIVKSSALKPKVGSFLYRFLKHYQPQNCLELGTNIGFSMLYQASALKDKTFYTVEGCPNLATLARQHFELFNLTNIKLINISFEQAISSFNEQQKCWDYVFLDGHHTYDATISYVRALLPYMNKNSFIIVDDIYWSEGMKNAWAELIQLEQVSVSLNLFRLGILCFHRAQSKQDFVLLF